MYCKGKQVAILSVGNTSTCIITQSYTTYQYMVDSSSPRLLPDGLLCYGPESTVCEDQLTLKVHVAGSHDFPKVSIMLQ